MKKNRSLEAWEFGRRSVPSVWGPWHRGLYLLPKLYGIYDFYDTCLPLSRVL